MNIKAKITLMHFCIVVGSLAAIALIALRFANIGKLKSLELESIEALTELKILELKTTLFSRRNQNVGLLLEDLLSSIQRFDYLYNAMLNNPSHSLLAETEGASRNELYSEWNSAKKNELLPLIAELESAFAFSTELRKLMGGTSISISRELVAEEFGTASPVYLELTEIENLLTRQSEIVLGDIFESAESFINGLRLRISEYVSSLFFTTIAIALVFLAVGSFFALSFSRNLRRHATQMGNTLAKVASGVFDIKLDIQSGDEFESIASNFNLLTQELWTKIESMKDMIHEVGNAVERVNAVEEIEAFTLQLAVKNTNAHAGVFMGIDSKDELYPKHTQGNFPLLREHLGPVTTSGEPLFIRRNTGELPENADSNSEVFISSAIFIPIILSKAVVGVLALVHTEKGSYFNDLDYTYMCCYGQCISLTLDNMDRYNQLMRAYKAGREINVATGIQQSLLPEKMPAMQGIEIAAFSDSIKGIGGDFYDVFDIGENKTAIIICDVAGKGVSASLIMVMIRTIIRSISSPEKRADRIMIELNRAISGSVGVDKFATSSIIVLDSKNSIVSYSNAAHLPLYILRGNINKYHKFDTEGLPLGVENKTVFGHKKIRINKDDYLVLFTDGLSEARNNEGAELGTQTLLKFVARHADSNPDQLVKLVKNFVNEYSGGYEHDDQTFLALRVN